jgi:hypothetical protein
MLDNIPGGLGATTSAPGGEKSDETPPHDPAAPEPQAAAAPGKLAPDRDQLVRFVATMFKNARRDGWVSFRVFDDRGDKRPVIIQATRLDDYEFELLMLIPAEQAANWPRPAVFCPPVCTFKDYRNAKTDNIREGVALSVECDDAPVAARGKLEVLLGPATVVVASGGEWTDPETGEIEPKAHLHWRLKKPAAGVEELGLLYEARSLAATLVSADRSGISVVHPLRWPGSWHRKGTPKLARIAALAEDAEIELAEAVARLREAAGATKPDRSCGVPGSGPRGASDPSMVAQALAVIPNGVDPKAHGWEYWNRTGMTIWASTDGSEAGRTAFHKWSSRSPKYDPATTEARWQHYFRSPPNRLGFGSLVWRARQASPGWRYENMSAVTAEAIGSFIAQLLRERDEPDDGEEAGARASGAKASSASASSVIEPVDLWGRFDPPRLPRGLLPNVIEEFALDRAVTTGADESGFAVTALAVCAGAIPDAIQLQPKRHDPKWRESAALGGGHRLPLDHEKSDPRCAHRAAEAHRSSAGEHLSGRDGQMAGATEQGTGARPQKRRAVIYDTTIEATQEILRDSPGGVLLTDDELGGWFASMYKYSGAHSAQKDRSFWLQAYNGGPKTVDRVERGRGTVHIPNLSVSIAGMSQPGPIRKLANAGEDDGLLQRFNPLILRPATGGRDEPQGQACAEYDRLIEALYRLTAHAVLKFDDGALKIREALERKHLDLMQIDWLNRKLTSHFGKYNGMFARLCLIWHCIEHASTAGPLMQLPLVVTEATARKVASFLHDFLLKHAFAFYTGVLGLANDHDRLSNVADYILAHGRTHMTNRDIQRGDQTMRDLKRHETTAIFEQLEAMGWVDIVPSPRPGYPPHWVVNPLVHQRFAERAKASKERRERGRELVAAMMAADG